MKFEEDVFISYAHLDNQPLKKGAEGWITDFHKLLKTMLEQTIGHTLNVWRDEILTGNDILAPAIESQLTSSKVMVSIITPGYLSSTWCKRELDFFNKATDQNGGLSIGNKSRIFKVVKTPVDKEVMPADVRRLFDEILDYKFYIEGTGAGKFKELARYDWVEQEILHEYMDKVTDVVQDIASLIKKLNNAETADVEQKKIFLAETTYDLQSYRDNLVRELKEGGFIVLPDKSLPAVINKFTSDVEGFINESILSVHLVSSTNYAAQPEGSDKSTVILQNEIAAQKSVTNNLKRLIWIPPPLADASTNEKMIAQQKAFVDELKHNLEFQKGADILEGPLEEFKQAIFDTIKRVEAEEKAREDAIKEAEEKAKKLAATIAAGPVTVIENQGPKSVYLICDRRDLDNTRPLEDLMTDSGYEILLPSFDGDQTQLRDAHVASLKTCDAVIIYYGAGNYRWAGSMKSDLQRLPAMGRTKPLMGKSIYIAGPPDKDKETFKANDIEIITGLAGFTADLFNGFIQKLK